jgi:hypothetical protein
MNKIPIIRKGSYKDYLGSSFLGGLILGLFSFLLSLLLGNSAIDSFWIGFSLWFGMIILVIGVGFTSEEYFKRKREIKKLLSDKYSFLDSISFELHQDLYFAGIYQDYHFRVIPRTKWQERQKDIEYVIIEAFYRFDTDHDGISKETNLSGEYFLGHLHFANQCVGFIPKDWELPDFKENFDGLISILKRQKLFPFPRVEWENTIGKRLKEMDEIETKSRTKQILKIGKLEMKYTKQKNKVSH